MFHKTDFTPFQELLDHLFNALGFLNVEKLIRETFLKVGYDSEMTCFVNGFQRTLIIPCTTLRVSDVVIRCG